MAKTIGILHPGAMGASIAACAAAAGAHVVWASEGRSTATVDRASAAELHDVGTLSALVEASEIVLCVCPPDAAAALAGSVFALGFRGLYVDANASDPASTRGLAEAAARAGAEFVDGGIVGPPAKAKGATVLYLSGDASPLKRVAQLFKGSVLETIAIPGGAGKASALKMAYAAYTKGNSALLLAVRALARAEGVEAELLGHWARTHPGLALTSEAMAGMTGPKAWRFAGEMERIAATFGAAGLPSGFHEAAADFYSRLDALKDEQAVTLDRLLAEVLARPGRNR